MNVVDDAFGWRDLPMFADRAARLADAVRALSYDEAKALWQCSDALAELNFERFRTLDVRSGALTPAVLAYEGIQYQNLAPQVMTMEQLDYLQEHLRILSGLYGVVRPLDGVAPYRPSFPLRIAAGQECSPACSAPSTRAIASCSAPPPRKPRAVPWCAGAPRTPLKNLPTCKPSMRSATRSIPLGRPTIAMYSFRNSHA